MSWMVRVPSSHDNHYPGRRLYNDKQPVDIEDDSSLFVWSLKPRACRPPFFLNKRWLLSVESPSWCVCWSAFKIGPMPPAFLRPLIKIFSHCWSETLPLGVNKPWQKSGWQWMTLIFLSVLSSCSIITDSHYYYIFLGSVPYGPLSCRAWWQSHIHLRWPLPRACRLRGL